MPDRKLKNEKRTIAVNTLRALARRWRRRAQALRKREFFASAEELMVAAKELEEEVRGTVQEDEK
jgi:hypothetical protein